MSENAAESMTYSSEKMTNVQKRVNKYIVHAQIHYSSGLYFYQRYLARKTFTEQHYRPLPFGSQLQTYKKLSFTWKWTDTVKISIAYGKYHLTTRQPDFTPVAVSRICFKFLIFAESKLEVTKA